MQVHVDDNELKAASDASGRSDAAEIVSLALTEYVALVKRKSLIDLFGTIDYLPGFPKPREKSLPHVFDGDEPADAEQ